MSKRKTISTETQLRQAAKEAQEDLITVSRRRLVKRVHAAE